MEAPIANHKGVRCASSGVASCQLSRMGGGGANEPTEEKNHIIFLGLKILTSYIRYFFQYLVVPSDTLSAVGQRNEPKHLGGAIFAREQSDQARGSVATERGEGVVGGGGCPPSHGRELFSFFDLKMCNLGHT